MGATKTKQYSTKQLSFARTAKAIGHPARVAIVQHLAEFGLANNIDLIRVTRLCDATVSQHLSELQRAGIITGLFLHELHFYKLTLDAERAVDELTMIFLGNTEKRRGQSTKLKK